MVHDALLMVEHPMRFPVAGRYACERAFRRRSAMTAEAGLPLPAVLREVVYNSDKYK